MKDFERAISLTVPLSVTQAEQIHQLREWANVRAVAATQTEDRSSYALAGQAASKMELAAPTTPENIAGSRGGRPIDF